jgi:putative ABC transport system substrate-binding protein
MPTLKPGLQRFGRDCRRFGWIEGRNLQIDARWGAGDAGAIASAATELAALAPDVIVASGSAAAAILQATRTVPIVFVSVPDPVGSGFVESLAQPGGNATAL